MGIQCIFPNDVYVLYLVLFYYLFYSYFAYLIIKTNFNQWKETHCFNKFSFTSNGERICETENEVNDILGFTRELLVDLSLL